MNEPERGLATLGLDKAIRLRWALRDFRGKRLKLTPVDPNDLRTLIDMGYVEMKDDQPVVTNAGLEEIEIGVTEAPAPPGGSGAGALFRVAAATLCTGRHLNASAASPNARLMFLLPRPNSCALMHIGLGR